MAVNAENIGDYQHSEGVGNEPEVQNEEVVSQEGEGNTPQVENQETPENENPWDVEHLRGEDGMVAGKYKNIDAMVKSLEHAEAKLVELNAEKQSASAKGQNAEKAEARKAEVQQAETAAMEQYIQNGQMTPELAAQITEAGGDPTRVELNGIKTSQRLNSLYDITDGRENFEAMLTEMAEGKSEAEKNAWINTLRDPSMSEYAVKGLHAEWQEKNGRRSAPADRVRGRAPSGGSTKPYATQGEMLQGAAKARHSQAARQEYEMRKNVTPDSVVFGR